tara:strand:- start:2526 stop:2900 length:375 start_codon:yes stop_codon:yes gene_type:complete
MAINGFENKTYELTEYEKNVLLPTLIKGLRTKIGVEKAVTSNQILERLQNKGFDLNSARIRKLINYIRVNHEIPFLMASSKGYYIEHDVTKMKSYIESLKQRANSILNVAQCLDKQLKNRYYGM